MTMKRIVVGSDGSEGSRRTISWVARLARRLESEVVVVNAFTPVDTELPPDHLDELRAEHAADIDDQACEPLRTENVAHRVAAIDGDPAKVLLDVAREEDAAMVAVGSRGAGGFLDLRLGSVTDHLAHHVERPLLVVPHDVDSSRPLECFVLGLDGSDGSAAAARWTADAAHALGARVVGVHALEPWGDYLPLMDEPDAARRVTALLQHDWTAPLHDAGVPVTTRLVEQHHPIAALAKTVEEEKADLVVVGARGIGGFLGLRLGGTALQALHHVPVPVVVVPPAT